MTTLELSTLLSQPGASVRLLDVRTPSEFDDAHIEGAYNVPLHLLHEHASDLKQVREPVVLLCQSGRRAMQAEQLLHRTGMPNVRVLDGGIAAWIAAGHRVNRTRPRVSLERQVRMTAGAIVALGAAGALMVHPLLAIVPLLIGSGLVFAGATDTCAMGMLLAKLPYNSQSASCDTEAIVQRFLEPRR